MFGKLSVVVLQAMPAAVGQPAAPVPAVEAPQVTGTLIIQLDWFWNFECE